MARRYYSIMKGSKTAENPPVSPFMKGGNRGIYVITALFPHFNVLCSCPFMGRPSVNILSKIADESATTVATQSLQISGMIPGLCSPFNKGGLRGIFNLTRNYCIFFFTLLNLLVLFSDADAFFQPVYKTTFTASITFADSAPQITHTAIERVSLITKTAIIEGTAADNLRVASVNIYYKKLSETSFTISTLTPQTSVKEYKFSYQIPQDIITGSIQYRISVYDSGLNEAKMPADGSWFTVQAYDTLAKQIGSAGGSITLADGNPNDGETSIEIPPGALDFAINITITEVDPNDSSVVPYNSIRPVAVFRFEPKGLVFKKLVKINLLYQDVNNDGIVDKTQYDETGLKIMWWDGFEWRYMGGKLDQNLNLVSTRINHFSLYGVFPLPSLTDNDYRPKERIVTPASIDKYNDYATFGGLEEGDVVHIFDVTGKTIRQLKDTTIWNGKDDNGDIAESGLYIYQIKAKATGKIISGTIVVAK